MLRVLVDNIVNTCLEPGEKLNEPELCQQLGVSRMPFREAELELVQRRLIEIRPKIGTYVSLIDAELVEEVRHLRAVLEIDLAEMACQMLNNQQLDHLWENVALWQTNKTFFIPQILPKSGLIPRFFGIHQRPKKFNRRLFTIIFIA